VQNKQLEERKTIPHVSYLVAEALRTVLVPLLRPTLPSSLLGELMREERVAAATTAVTPTATLPTPHGEPPLYLGLPEVHTLVLTQTYAPASISVYLLFPAARTCIWCGRS
jgi:hypothetical protein